METSVELHVFFLGSCIIIVIVVIFLTGRSFLCSLLFSLLSVFFLISLNLVKSDNGFLVGLLSTREKDDSSEPLTCEDQLIPEADTLKSIEMLEPELKLFPVCQMVAPNLLQHGMHTMILLITPS